MKYRRKAGLIEAVTFDEFVEIGKKSPDANIVNDMPWYFYYKGHKVTHENNGCYLIPNKIGFITFNFDDVLITEESEMYTLNKTVFEKLYELANDC